MPLPRTLVRSLVTLGALTGLGAAFVAGAWSGGDGPRPAPWSPPDSDVSPAAYTGSDLSLPGSCEELLESYVERGVDRVGPWGWDGGYGYPVPMEDGILGSAMDEAAGDAEMAGSASQSAAAPTTVRATNGDTGTNVQEAGVDEPDTVKTDGRTLFRVEDDDLVTYDVTGAEVRRLASTDLPDLDADGAELLLAGDTVVVIAATEERRSDVIGETASEGVTDVLTLDVSDPAAPWVTHSVEYDAGLVTARLHDGVVRLVLSAGLPDLDFIEPDRHTTDWEAERENRDLVRSTTIEDWLPTSSVDGDDPEQLVACEDVAVPDDDAALGTLVVAGFDAAAPDAPSASGLALDTDLVYASTDQLFLATTPSWGGCWDCAQPMPMPWPESGTSSLVPRWFPGGDSPEEGASDIYAFDVDGIDTVFAASGEVDGVIRDRWAMDEHDGVLRLAVGPSSRTGDFNSVLTLRQEGNDLVEAGRVDELGVGEEIQSVRWFDTLAIVVTFRQVDPLYAIDLTDSDAPRLMGELKIPGFSAYLHPLGERRLLGLGEGPTGSEGVEGFGGTDGSGAEGGWGAQAGLFDVTDLTDPARIDVVSYGSGTQALATQDPRQLTWLPESRTVLSVVADYDKRGEVGYVSVLTVGDGELANRMVEVEHGAEVRAVRLVPLLDGRVVLVTGDDASFFDL